MLRRLHHAGLPVQINRSFVLRVIYALCLAGATCIHATIAWQHGLLWDYGGAPLFTCIYWTSLTFLDPLALGLLFVRPPIGLVLTAVIISSDVLHNTWIWIHYRQPLNSMYISQVIFLVFVASTFRIAWRNPPRGIFR